MKISLYTGLTALLSFVTCYESLAQKEAKFYYEADEAMSAEKYGKATELFVEVMAIDPYFEGTEYKITACEILINANQSIEPYKGLESKYSKDEYYYYWLGKIQMSRYLFEDASESFKRFRELSEYSGNTNDASIKSLLQSTTHLMPFFDNPDNFEIHQLESPINTAGNELTPVYSEGNKELLFASNNNSDSYKIYYSKRQPEGWSSPKELSVFGSFSESTANVEVVNEDGKLFIFKEDNGGDLYYSQPDGDKWTAPVEFDSRVSNNQLHSHFFINEHEDRIIFSSEDKANKLDIYESFKDPSNGKWSKPAPFSTAINSAFNEDSPYLSADEKSLYFVSDRPGGVGGYDVYVSKYDAVNFTWGEPVNLGWPLNSPDDEFHFKMNADQSSGYFVSDRVHSKGGFDIYFFWEVEKVKITGRLIDAQGKPLSNAQIRFHPSQYTDEYFHSTSDASGIYATEIFSDEIFSVEIISGGKVIFNDKFEVHDAKGQAITHHKDFRMN